MKAPVYLDYNATTPVAPQVVEAMLPHLAEHFGNPSSSHVYGQRAAQAVREARALTGKTRHLVVSAVEHPAVMAPVLQLQSEGWNLSVIPVDHYGRVDPTRVAASLRPDTALVSIMHANNEVGTIRPIAEIAAITKAHGVLLHTDAAQSVGKIPVDVDAPSHVSSNSPSRIGCLGAGSWWSRERSRAVAEMQLSVIGVC